MTEHTPNKRMRAKQIIDSKFHFLKMSHKCMTYLDFEEFAVDTDIPIYSSHSRSKCREGTSFI